ncbi:unnamed protein product [Arctia plantaginis]|uniref:Uncharacterized protein n=1 Tax=Arctia plantaginis TaxID=874455 RepID=A0A8S1BY76_ARCPL|nr:unnamed protein product [Arctia plantaginis]
MNDPERIAARRVACELINNATAPPEGLHCAGTYDSWQCWPHAAPNTTVYRPCPVFVPGFSPELMAHKECMANGSWFRTLRRPALVQLHHLHQARGSSPSSRCCFRSSSFSTSRTYGVRASRVHMNLFASFAANNALWLVWYGLVVPSPDTLRDSPVWCCALNTILQYAMLTTYTWMLCEGLYLHTVLVSAFVSERRLLRALLLLGWGLPVTSAAIYAGRRGAAGDTICWSDEGQPRPELIVLGVRRSSPQRGVLVQHCARTVHKVACGRVSGGRRWPAQTFRHRATRVTCHLPVSTVAGLQYLLMLIRPEPTERWWLAYEYVSALTTSLQGLCVAVLYCFCNGEVLAQLRRRWRVLNVPAASQLRHCDNGIVRAVGGWRT